MCHLVLMANLLLFAKCHNKNNKNKNNITSLIRNLFIYTYPDYSTMKANWCGCTRRMWTGWNS